MKITPEMIRNAFVTKGITPVRGEFNLRINMDAEGGPEFECMNMCGCAVSALVHGEKLTQSDVQAFTAEYALFAVAHPDDVLVPPDAVAAAENHLRINTVWDDNTKLFMPARDRFSYHQMFDAEDSPGWLAVKDLVPTLP